MVKKKREHFFEGDGLLSQWLLYFLFVFFILHIPRLNLYFAALNTMFHEMGHAIVCLLFKGRVVKISLFPNTEGQIITASGSWISRVLISYAGYTFSPLVAYGCFYLIGEGMHLNLLYGFIGVSVMNLVLWVRNLYGLFWLTSFIGLCLLFVYIGHSGAIEIFVQFLAALLLVESIRSAFIICLLSFRDKRQAGDATSLAKSTFIPAFFWGTLFFVQSMMVAYWIFSSLIV
ncbi:M50 family metallopeptidase [Anaerobacillus isosaccharinicus]|uniref:M50 family metallopeptidase n=1 Tax=Anaerobacillus isosaccharinicus TaxID=1532552 RepID=A0A7S7RAY4_9BACI|nr:M50 family metallopeptidase [Anaerobacillus isosaccharinicus]MBA5586379.1 M50 family metallopeptidase [Anaerobacillus isosaccharinicus]QOY35375.1 M50 family metallopeptidase [Anaerobacillus isosaccharinicus]